MTNSLEKLLYPTSIEDTKTTSLSPFERGMFITMNNHKSDAIDLSQSLKRIYGSIYFALTEEQISRDKIIISTGKVPSRKRIMDMVVKEAPIVVAGIHKYNCWNQSIGRGSKTNYNYYHLHLYVYGTHHYLNGSDAKVKLEKVNAYLKRYLNAPKKLAGNPVDIREVGINSNSKKDLVTPTSVFDYLNMPDKNPEKDSCINYIAETKRPKEDRHPLYFIYQDI